MTKGELQQKAEQELKENGVPGTFINEFLKDKKLETEHDFEAFVIGCQDAYINKSIDSWVEDNK
ncbi:MAG: hypothetical protein AB7E36_14860 [Salinivirgaceae bacterium]